MSTDADHGSAAAPAGGAAAPLAGVKVADFSRVLAGPFATMTLADFGADVIKIERPSGDDTRSWTPPVDEFGVGTYYSSINRNKRSVMCDLSIPEGLAEATAIALEADVVIENFRPGIMERYGLDYECLRTKRAGLIYCSITGFGNAGGAHMPGYDMLVQAVGGLMSITGSPDSEPSKVGVALVDVLTGQNAVVGILAALRSRDQTGQGQRVDVNLLSSLLSSLSNQASSTLATGKAPERMGNAHPSVAPYDTFATADSSLVIAVGNDKQFQELVRLLGVPEMADDERFATNSARITNRVDMKALLEDQLQARTAAEWTEMCTAAGVPAGKVNSIAEAIELAETLGLAPVVEMSNEMQTRKSRHIASPIQLSGTPAQYRRMPPELGEHNGASFEQ